MKVMGAEDFPQLPRHVPTPMERERSKRIRLCVATYGYEIADKPIMDDRTWDELAQSIDKYTGTAHPLIDEFFVTQFSPMTGMWIHNHPELDGIARIYKRYYAALRDYYESPAVQRRLRA